MAQCPHDRQQLIAHHAALEHRLSVPVDAMQLKNVLRQINAQDIYRHKCSPSGSRPAQLAGGEGEPSIPLGGGKSMVAWRLISSNA
jgi:hypothetical protein